MSDTVRMDLSYLLHRAIDGSDVHCVGTVESTIERRSDCLHTFYRKDLERIQDNINHVLIETEAPKDNRIEELEKRIDSLQKQINTTGDQMNQARNALLSTAKIITGRLG